MATRLFDQSLLYIIVVIWNAHFGKSDNGNLAKSIKVVISLELLYLGQFKVDYCAFLATAFHNAYAHVTLF